MPEKKRSTEEKLELLSQEVDAGWKQSHPVPENLKALVEHTVSQQLEEERKLTQEQRQTRIQEEQKKTRAEQQTQQIEESQRQERDRRR